MIKAKTQAITIARTIRTRTSVAVAALSMVLGGLIAFASVQISQGGPPPLKLMTVTAMPTVPVAAPPVIQEVAQADVSDVSQEEPAQSQVTVDALIQAQWQTAGDPPLPDHDPWTEMARSAPAKAVPSFNNRPLRKARTLRMLVTAYSPDEQSCGIHADGITASGFSVYTNGMKLVAADTRLLPFGSIVTIPGYNGGKPVPVLDRGGKIKGKRLDVLYPTHQRALQWGAQYLDVTVWTYAD